MNGIEPRHDFPLEILPEWARAYVESLAHVLQVDASLPTLAVLGAVATAVQSKAEVHVRGGWEEQLSFWCFLSLRSGNRKSPALMKALGPIWRYQRRENERRKRYREAIEAAVERIPPRAADAKSRKRKLEEAEPPLLEMICTDATPEAAALMLKQQNEAGAIATDEPSSVANVMKGMYSEQGMSNLGIFMAGYSGSPYVRKRVKSENASLERPVLSMLLFGQPEVLGDLAESRNLISLGFIGRLLVCCPPDRLGDREVHADDVPESVRNVYYARMDAILGAPFREPLPDTGATWVSEDDPPSWPEGSIPRFRLELTEDARALHMDFERKIEPMLREDGPLGALSDFGAKLAGQVARIAALVHVLDHPETWWKEPVSEIAMGGALEAGRYALGEVLRLHSTSQREKAVAEKAKTVLEAARALAREEPEKRRLVTFRQLRRRVISGHGRGRLQSPEELEEALEELEESGDLILDRQYTRGKRWAVR